MPSLRDYRDRIKSVTSTRKITSAMKMVAASKLRRAQEQAEAAQPYATAMAAMLARVAKNAVVNESSSKLLVGTGSQQRHLLVAVSADRGLCGGFNSNIAKKIRQQIIRLEREGKDVSILCVGRKAADVLRSTHASFIEKTMTGITGKSRVEFSEASKVTQYILEEFTSGKFDVCTLVYNEFISILTQTPEAQQIIPFKVADANDQAQLAKADSTKADSVEEEESLCPYSFEPEEDEILNALLPRNLGVQVYRALLDSSAGEQAARMTAMENATSNAGDMIKELTLKYNRARQAQITKELIEIISGAEAV